MWKLILIAAIAFAIWKFYPSLTNVNVNDIENDTINNIKQEKTIKSVTETRQELNSETQNALNN